MPPFAEPALNQQLASDVERPWRWAANHTRRRLLPLGRGDRDTVRALVGACDGAAWPWTTVECGDEALSRHFQVPGTAELLLVEVGELDVGAWTVFRLVNSGFRLWVEMPSECAWWVPAIRADEALTADEATDIGMSWCGTAPCQRGMGCGSFISRSVA